MNEFKSMRKIELHLHLDGSLDINKIKEKYNLSNESIKQKMIADDKCKNLNDYLTKFEFPVSILQTKEDLEEATINLLNKLKEQNVIYVELRFAPQLHTNGGLSQEEIVKIVINAKAKVDIKSNLILCFMRGENNMEDNYETLEVAKKYLGKGVCAVDLAGAEALFKTNNYNKIFEKAREYNIPFTIHAGEADGASSIKSAISFGAQRIGHGIRCLEDEEVLNCIINNNITLEVCVTSNIQTCICDSYNSHPIENLYRTGVKVTLNTDNMTVSNTSLENEYEKLVKNTNLTKDDIIKMNINSVNCAFISPEEKERLIFKIKNI